MDKSDPLQSAQETTGDESFFRRWSARKQQLVQPEIQAPKTVDNAQIEPPAPALTDADMPPLESLNEQSDYSGFFSPKVSTELKRLALRKLFHSASFNVTDGLDDYAEDFTQFAALGDIITQDMRHMMDVIKQREAKQAADESTASAPADADSPDSEETAATNETEQQDPAPKPDDHPA
ncbi:MAG: DUF3306 domain-containing protein [Candidatus Competibacteraceae bacterium]|nr:DUF3306 domain-containing protein [Candidatus Competibacteraceae bacterium]